MSAVLDLPRVRTLSILDVTDFYLPDSGDLEWQQKGYAYTIGSQEIHALSSLDPAAMDILTRLVSSCRESQWDQEDPNKVFILDDIPFRVHFDQDEPADSKNRGLFIVRRGATTVPALDDLNLPPWWPEILTSAHLNKGGLVIISGSTGSGKTTLLYSAVQARLQMFAGHARSIENPVELRLKDWVVGKGLFVQTEPRRDIPYQDAMEKALNEAMRAFPSISSAKILMLGEMRHPVVAAGALTAADSGHLVLVSSHGSTLIDSIRRFAAYAGTYLGKDLAREMMGGTLRAVFHQQIKWLPHNSGMDRGMVEGRVLLLREASDVDKPGDVSNIVSDPTKKLVTLNQSVGDQSERLRQAADQCRYGTLKPAERRTKWRELGTTMDIFGGLSKS